MYLVALLNFSNYFIVKSKYCTPKFKVNEKMIGSYKIKLLTTMPTFFLDGISYQRSLSGKKIANDLEIEMFFGTFTRMFCYFIRKYILFSKKQGYLWWSTCVLVYFSWLHDHVIYFKPRREQV